MAMKARSQAYRVRTSMSYASTSISMVHSRIRAMWSRAAETIASDGNFVAIG